MSYLPEAAAKLPADQRYDNLRQDVENFVQAVAGLKIQDDTSGAADALSRLDVQTGQTLAQSAADKMNQLIGKCNAMGKSGKSCLRFKPSIHLGNTLEQILSAMRGGKQNGQGSGSGFSMFPNDVAVYGPNAERMAGREGGAEQSLPAQRNTETGGIASNPADPGLKTPQVAGRVRLQPNAKFPLRYRDLVGDYFRAVAESRQQ